MYKILIAEIKISINVLDKKWIWSSDGINELDDEVREQSQNKWLRNVSINLMSYQIREKIKGDGNI